MLAEGLAARHARHQLHGRALRAGVTALGLNLLATEPHQLPMLTAVKLPENIEAAVLRRALLEEDGIEIGGGLGDTARSVVRIGIMGYNAERRNVVHMLAALERLLPRFGYKIPAGIGVAAAEGIYATNEVKDVL